MHNPGLENVDFCVDGMAFHVPAPSQANDSDGRRHRLWSGKLRAFVATGLVVKTLNGLICGLSKPAEVPEQASVVDLDLKSKFLELGVGVVSDAGFTFNYVADSAENMIDYGFTVGPKTLQRLQNMASDPSRPADTRQMAVQALHSTKLASQMRIVVENTIGRLRKFRILDSKFRQYLNTGMYSVHLADVMAGLSFVLNRKLLKSPCRADDWSPAGPSAPGVCYGYPGSPPSAKVFARYIKKVAEQVGSGGLGSRQGRGRSPNGTVPAGLRRGRKRARDGPVDRSAPISVDWKNYEVVGDYYVQGKLMPKVRAPVDSRKEHVVVGQYDDLDKAERKRLYRRADQPPAQTP
jgi:hypothetical protein